MANTQTGISTTALNNPVYYTKIPSSSMARKVEVKGSDAGKDGVEFEKSFLAAATFLGLPYTEIEGGALWDIRPTGSEWADAVMDKNINIKIAYTDWMFQDNIVGRMLPWSDASFDQWGPVLFGPDTITAMGSKFPLSSPEDVEDARDIVKLIPVDPRKKALQEERLRRYLHGVMKLQDYLFMSPMTRAIQYQLVDEVAAFYKIQTKEVTKGKKSETVALRTMGEKKRVEAAKSLERLNELFCDAKGFHSYKFPENFKVRLVMTSDYVMVPLNLQRLTAYGKPGLQYLEILVGGVPVARGKLFMDSGGLASFRFASLGTKKAGSRTTGTAWVKSDAKAKHAKVGFDGKPDGLVHAVKKNLDYRPWLDQSQAQSYEAPETRIYSASQADLTGEDAILGGSFGALSLLKQKEKWSETKEEKGVERTIQKEGLEPAIVLHRGPTQSKIGFFGIEARNSKGQAVLPPNVPLRTKVALKVVGAEGVVLRDGTIKSWVWENQSGVEDMARWSMGESVSSRLPLVFQKENSKARKDLLAAYRKAKGGISSGMADPKGYKEGPKVKRVADIDVSPSLAQRMEFVYGWIYDTMGVFGVGKKRAGQLWKKGAEAQEGDDSLDLDDDGEETEEQKAAKEDVKKGEADKKAKAELKARRMAGQKQIVKEANSFPGGYYFVKLKNPGVLSAKGLSPEERLNLMVALLKTGEMEYVKVPEDNIRIKIAVGSGAAIHGVVVTDEKNAPFMTVRPGKDMKGSSFSLFDSKTDSSLLRLANARAGDIGQERFGAGLELSQAKEMVKDALRVARAQPFSRPMRGMFATTQKRATLALSGGVGQDIGLGTGYQSLPRVNVAERVNAARSFFEPYVGLLHVIETKADRVSKLVSDMMASSVPLNDDLAELKQLADFFQELEDANKADSLGQDLVEVERLYRKDIEDLVASGLDFGFTFDAGQTFSKLKSALRLAWAAVHPDEVRAYTVAKANGQAAPHPVTAKKWDIVTELVDNLYEFINKSKAKSGLTPSFFWKSYLSYAPA